MLSQQTARENSYLLLEGTNQLAPSGKKFSMYIFTVPLLKFIHTTETIHQGFSGSF